MSLSERSLNKKITEQELMRRVYALSKEFRRVEQTYNTKINQLAQKYIKHATNIKVGDTVTLVNNPDGYTHFKIEKILPDINWEKKEVRLRAVGQASGFEMETAEKTIYLDEIKRHFSNRPVEVSTEKEGI